MAIIVVMEIGNIRTKLDEPFPWMDDARRFAEAMSRKLPHASFDVVERKDGNPAEDLVIQTFAGAGFRKEVLFVEPDAVCHLQSVVLDKVREHKELIEQTKDTGAGRLLKNVEGTLLGYLMPVEEQLTEIIERDQGLIDTSPG